MRYGEIANEGVIKSVFLLLAVIGRCCMFKIYILFGGKNQKEPDFWWCRALVWDLVHWFILFSVQAVGEWFLWGKLVATLV